MTVHMIGQPKIEQRCRGLREVVMSSAEKLIELIDLPGFQCIFKQRKGVAVHYHIGIDPYTIDGDPLGKMLWGYGFSLGEAIDNWWQMHGYTHPHANAQKYWLKMSANALIKK